MPRSKRRRKALIIAVVALVVLAALVFWNREPRHEGKTISEWADIGLKATDQTPWDTPNVLLASNAIRQIGTQALETRYLRRDPDNEFRVKTANLVSEIGRPGEIVAEWLWTSAWEHIESDFERGSFISYSLASDTNVFLPRLLTYELLDVRAVAGALDETHAPWLVEVFLNQTNPAARNAGFVLSSMWPKTSTAGPALMSFVETNRNDPKWEAAARLLARSHHRSEDTAALILADHALSPEEKLGMFEFLGEPGINAMNGFLNATNAVVRSQALMRLLLHGEKRRLREQGIALLLRFEKLEGLSTISPLPADWRPPDEALQALQKADADTQMAAVTETTSLLALDDTTLEKLVSRVMPPGDFYASHLRQALRAFLTEMTNSASSEVAEAARAALQALPPAPKP